MKLQLLLFFTFFTPLVLFFSILIYGGITTGEVKKAVLESGAYSQISAHFIKPDPTIPAQFRNYPVFISSSLTAVYFRKITEAAIDDSANWITGKTQKPPTISFKGLKEELQTNYPDLLKEIEYIPTQSELQNSHLNVQQQTSYLDQAKQLSAFAKANFTFSFGNKLDGIKLAYKLLQILVPLLIIALIVSILLLIKLADNPPSRYKWVGTTLLASSIAGYICVLLHPYVATFLSETHLLQESEFFSLFSPVLLAIANYYMQTYAGYQMLLSTVFLIWAAGCFVGAFITRKQAPPAIKPVYEAHAPWETPQELPPVQSTESQTQTTKNEISS